MNRNIFIWLIKSTLLHNTVADNIITKGTYSIMKKNHC